MGRGLSRIYSKHNIRSEKEGGLLVRCCWVKKVLLMTDVPRGQSGDHSRGTATRAGTRTKGVQTMNRLLTIIVGLLLAALVVGACSPSISQDKPESTSTAPPSPPAAGTTTTAVAAGAPAGRVPLKEAVNSLEPQEVWQNFYELTQVPRPSHHEESGPAPASTAPATAVAQTDVARATAARRSRRSGPSCRSSRNRDMFRNIFLP